MQTIDRLSLDWSVSETVLLRVLGRPIFIRPAGSLFLVSVSVFHPKAKRLPLSRNNYLIILSDFIF
jgi:hypothetical protein